MPLGSVLLQFLGWMALLGAVYLLIDRLGILGGPSRFTEETITRLWRESAAAGGEESGPAPNRLLLNRARAAGVDGDDARPLTKFGQVD